MSGFTLYETLRILVPGLLATLIGRSVLWIVGATSGVEIAKRLPMIDSTSFSLSLSLLLGLLLYSFDLPSRLMISKEGSGWGKLPSNKLLEILGNGTVWGDTPFGLYFLLSDRYLPAETHRRVYLFGSLFRVFVDLRFLLGIATATGCALSLSVANRTAHLEWSWEATIFALLPLMGVALMGIPGERDHKRNKLLKNDELSNSLGEYEKTRNAGIARLGVLYFSIFATGSGAVASLLAASAPLTIVAVVLAGVSVAMWFWIEIGKPSEQKHAKESTAPNGQQIGPDSTIPWNTTDARSYVMLKLGVDHHEPNFWPVQRTIADIVFFAPWIAAASITIALSGAHKETVLLWALLILPCSLIAAVRKHEIRLLATYREQSNWLEHHSADVKTIASTGKLPDQWN